MLRVVIGGVLVLASANNYGMDRLKKGIGDIVAAGWAFWFVQGLLIPGNTVPGVPARVDQSPAVVSKVVSADCTCISFIGPGIVTAEELVSLRDVKTLMLSRCQLKGGIPSIKGLEEFELFSVSFDDTDAEFAALEVLPTDLKKLAIIQSGVLVVPDEVASMKGLNTLDLSKNIGLQINDNAFPACLDCLILDGCGFAQVPKAIAELPRLKRLSLRGNAYNLVVNVTDLPASLQVLRVDSLRQFGKDIILNPILRRDKDGFFYIALEGRVKIYVTERHFIPDEEE